MIWFSQARQVKLLSNEEAGILFKSIIEYAQAGKTAAPVSNNRIVEIVFEGFKNSIDRDKENYFDTIRRKSEGGKKGARRRYGKTAEQLREPQEPPQRKAREQQARPTLTQVIEYCKKRNLKIDGYRFYDYYSAQGWIRNGQPVTDWQSLAEQWHRTEYNNKPAPRNITPEDDILQQEANTVPEFNFDT